MSLHKVLRNRGPLKIIKIITNQMSFKRGHFINTAYYDIFFKVSLGSPYCGLEKCSDPKTIIMYFFTSILILSLTFTVQWALCLTLCIGEYPDHKTMFINKNIYAVFTALHLDQDTEGFHSAKNSLIKRQEKYFFSTFYS